MAHVSDFTQAPQKILLDLINEDNNSTLTEAAVDVALHEEQTPATKNTLAVVTPKAGSGYSGSVAVEYNRLDISGFVDLYYPNGFVIPLGDTETFLDLIPEIEAGLGIKLTENLDYEDQIIEPWEGIPNETKNIVVPMLEASLIYIGELEFILDGNDIPLDSVITVIVLDGLNLPAAEEPDVPTYPSMVRTGNFFLEYQPSIDGSGAIGGNAPLTEQPLDVLIQGAALEAPTGLFDQKGVTITDNQTNVYLKVPEGSSLLGTLQNLTSMTFNISGTAPFVVPRIWSDVDIVNIGSAVNGFYNVRLSFNGRPSAPATIAQFGDRSVTIEFSTL